MPKSLFILLDIDNTLYEFSKTGFCTEMRDRIYLYVEKHAGLTHEEAVRMSHHYLGSYGLSLHGYVKHHGVDAQAYSDYVHQCSYDRLTRNAPLCEMLCRMQFRSDKKEDADSTTRAEALSESGRHHLYFFTNANRPHARKILEPLGLKNVFTRKPQAASPVRAFHKQYDDEGFEEDVEWVGFSYEDQWRLTSGEQANKPMKAAYMGVFDAIAAEIALDGQGGSEGGGPLADIVAQKRKALLPENMVMVDDSIMNLNAPLELGWSAVWVSYGAELPADKPLYRQAVVEGRLKVIHDIMGLEAVVAELESS